MMNKAVEARGLTVSRGGHEVLHGLDFTVGHGEITGLLGPSGCGKSTLMRALVGVQTGVRGSMRVLGQPAGSSDLRSRIGYQTQAVSVYADLTVRENLTFFAQVLGVAPTEVGRVIGAVDLAAEAHRVVSALSGGQRSRVSLAAALLGSPELLVLDEPTVGLDPVLRNDLWDLFATVAARGTAVLVSSHVMDEAERCDRLLLMRRGHLLADETPAHLKERTGARDVERAFLAIVAAAQ